MLIPYQIPRSQSTSVGAVREPPTTPSTPADTPDTGAPAPGYVVLLIMLALGVILLTGIGRIILVNARA